MKNTLALSVFLTLIGTSSATAATFDRLDFGTTGNVPGGGSFVNFSVFNGDMDNPGSNIDDFEIAITTPGGLVDFTRSDDPEGWTLMNVAGVPNQAVWATATDPIMPNQGLSGFNLTTTNLRTFTVEWSTTLDGVAQSSGTFSISNGNLVKTPESSTIFGLLAFTTFSLALKSKSAMKQLK